MQNQISLPSAKRVAGFFLAVVILLLTISMLGQISAHVFDHPKLKGLVPAFYVDLESNIPTWYSSFALAVAALLLLIIAAVKIQRTEPYRFHWLALSALFLLLSADEIAMLHEYPIDPMREYFKMGGALYYPWVIPGSLFVVAMFTFFIRFVLQLPRATMLLFFAAGGVFVGGAIGIEMISATIADASGENNLAYACIVTLEEACEMFGVVIFIYALCDYIEREIGSLSFITNHQATA